MKPCYPPANLKTTAANRKEQESLFGLSKTKLRIELSTAPSQERVTVLLPVLNEAGRIDACLAALCQQPEEVQEILVIDGGSNDGTQGIVQRHHTLDATCKIDRRQSGGPALDWKSLGTAPGFAECVIRKRLDTLRRRGCHGPTAAGALAAAPRSKKRRSEFFPWRPDNGCRAISKR